MTLTINQNVVDFSLETEKTLADLATSLHEWADSQGSTILSGLVDGQAWDWRDDRPLTGVALVELEMVSVAQRPSSQLAICEEFLAQVQSVWPNLSDRQKKEWSDEVPPIRETLRSLLGDLADGAEQALENLANPAWDDQSEWCQILTVRIAKFRALVLAPGAAQGLWKAWCDLLDAVPEIAANFQQGNDQQAYGQVARLFAALMRLDICMASRNSIPEDWNKYRQEIGPFVREAQIALDNQDLILATDLLEYELAMRTRDQGSSPRFLTVLDPDSSVI